jgi:S-formylglutathione hydrolase FrmB
MNSAAFARAAAPSRTQQPFARTTVSSGGVTSRDLPFAFFAPPDNPSNRPSLSAAEGRLGSAAGHCCFHGCREKNSTARSGWAGRNPVAAALSVLALAFSFAPSARAQGRAECREAPSKILGHAVPYCVIFPPSYDAAKTRRYPVLYFLHGLGGDAQSLINSGGLDMIEDLWQRRQATDFLIVTPSAGRSFYVNSRDGRVRYQDFFVREFLPFIETHYRLLRDRHHRGISGISMGGYGALRFAFLYPDVFGSVSAHSPALVQNPPRANVSSGQELAITRFLGSAFGSPFDPAYWTRQSPFTIVRDQPRPRGLRIYFDCGISDGYGFNRGAKAFHELLLSRGIPHEFHLYPGGHGWSYFAQHLPASFAFHSRAFGPAK